MLTICVGDFRIDEGRACLLERSPLCIDLEGSSPTMPVGAELVLGFVQALEH